MKRTLSIGSIYQDTLPFFPSSESTFVEGTNKSDKRRKPSRAMWWLMHAHSDASSNTTTLTSQSTTTPICKIEPSYSAPISTPQQSYLFTLDELDTTVEPSSSLDDEILQLEAMWTKFNHNCSSTSYLSYLTDDTVPTPTFEAPLSSIPSCESVTDLPIRSLQRCGSDGSSDIDYAPLMFSLSNDDLTCDPFTNAFIVPKDEKHQQRQSSLQQQPMESDSDSESFVSSPLSSSVTSPNMSPVLPTSVIEANNSNNNEQQIFTLQEQPRPKQRKCYVNENRYLIPNPVITLSSNPGITKATITASLAYDDGTPIDDSMNSPFLSSPNGLVQDLNARSVSAKFRLKVTVPERTSSKLRLRFNVEYQTSSDPDQVFKSQILSEPFIMQSNKSYNRKPPRVNSVTYHGLTADNEIRICVAGKYFDSNRARVLIDEAFARIEECTSSQIIATIPRTTAGPHNTQVRVSNGKRMKSNQTSNSVSFMYIQN